MSWLHRSGIMFVAPCMEVRKIYNTVNGLKPNKVWGPRKKVWANPNVFEIAKGLFNLCIFWQVVGYIVKCHLWFYILYFMYTKLYLQGRNEFMIKNESLPWVSFHSWVFYLMLKGPSMGKGSIFSHPSFVSRSLQVSGTEAKH